MSHVAESEQSLVERSGSCGRIHALETNWVVIRRAVVYYSLAAHAFSAGIKCRHCSSFHSSTASGLRILAGTDGSGDPGTELASLQQMSIRAFTYYINDCKETI